MKVNWKNDAYLQVSSMAVQTPVGPFFSSSTYINNPQTKGDIELDPTDVKMSISRQFQQIIQK